MMTTNSDRAKEIEAIVSAMIEYFDDRSIIVAEQQLSAAHDCEPEVSKLWTKIIYGLRKRLEAH